MSEVGEFINQVGIVPALAAGLFFLLEFRMRGLTKAVSETCRVQLQLLKATLRTRKENGGIEPDEKVLLDQLEERHPRLDIE